MFSLALALLGFTALCGALPFDGRIVGGRDVDIADYPYQLAMEVWNQQFCGASIISSEWVLTAAHCFVKMDVGSIINDGDLKVRAGSSARQSGGTLHTVNRLVRLAYDDVTHDQDFALMKVDPPFPLGKRGVQKIALATSELPAGTKVTVSGWGHTKFNGTNPASLKAVDITTITRDACRRVYGPKINNRMICAGEDAGGKDSCQGDSGGPLVDLARKVQVGVVSFGAGCADPHIPGVYSNIADPQVANWIQTTIRG